VILGAKKSPISGDQNPGGVDFEQVFQGAEKGEEKSRFGGEKKSRFRGDSKSRGMEIEEDLGRKK